MQFAMMAGDRGVRDVKGVVIHPPHRGAVHRQFMSATSHALILDNEFCHSYC